MSGRLRQFGGFMGVEMREPKERTPRKSQIDGYLYGVRAWNTVNVDMGDSDTFRVGIGLSAITARGGYHSAIWSPGQNVATCWKPWHQKGNAPKARCRCGFYAFKHAGYIDEDHHTVHGIVRMWGKVMYHEGGFRAQYAMPVYLQLMYGRGDRALREMYHDIPIEEYPDFSARGLRVRRRNYYDYDYLGRGFRVPLQHRLEQARREQW